MRALSDLRRPKNVAAAKFANKERNLQLTALPAHTVQMEFQETHATPAKAAQRPACATLTRVLLVHIRIALVQRPANRAPAILAYKVRLRAVSAKVEIVLFQRPTSIAYVITRLLVLVSAVPQPASVGQRLAMETKLLSAGVKWSVSLKMGSILAGTALGVQSMVPCMGYIANTSRAVTSTAITIASVTQIVLVESVRWQRCEYSALNPEAATILKCVGARIPLARCRRVAVLILRIVVR